eukprot:535527_1
MRLTRILLGGVLLVETRFGLVVGYVIRPCCNAITRPGTSRLVYGGEQKEQLIAWKRSIFCTRRVACSTIQEDINWLVEGIPKNDPEWQFFDTARVNIKAGDGGNGCVSFRREYCEPRGGPNGGNGSSGGSIFFVCDKGLNTLATLRNKVHYKAENGMNGQGKGRHAAKASDLWIRVPPGTVVRDQEGALCGELIQDGDELLVARGGRGGRGNEAFKTNRNTAPKFAEKGEMQINKWLLLELKLVADVGLVGCPNAGKSTLLAAISRAKPKIADYPFTTVVPNLGVWEPYSSDPSAAPSDHTGGKGLVVADIPGLLDGAYRGAGLGLSFLRHVQRCRVIVHVVDCAISDPIRAYHDIQQELELFNPRLLDKTQVVVLNKVDLLEDEELQRLERQFRNTCQHTRLFPISALMKQRTDELMRRVLKVVESLPRVGSLFDGEEEPIVLNADNKDSVDVSFEITSDPQYPRQWRVSGAHIERTVRMTDWDYIEAISRFQRILEATGVNDALRKAGVQQNDVVVIADHEFNFDDDEKGMVDSCVP